MANSSFAIWSDNINMDIDLHINCWIIEKGKDVLDFGLMISKANQNDKIFFYIPFSFDEKDISSLTEQVQNDESLRAMIFNEQLSTNQEHPSTPNCKFYNREDGKKFSFCLNNYEYEQNFEEGIKLTFSINSNPHGVDTYFRFRLNNVSEESIFERKERQVSSLTGVKEEHFNVEINMNQFRKLSNELQTSIHSSGDILNRVNMFLMADIDLSPIFSTHDKKPKTRILEDANKWGKYIELDNTKRYLAYQYKKVSIKEMESEGDDPTIEVRQPFKSFTIFSKFEQTLATKNFKRKAITTLIIIGVCSSLIVSGLLSIGESKESKEIKNLIKIVKNREKHLLSVKPLISQLQTDVNTSLGQIQILSNNLKRLQPISTLNNEKSTKTTVTKFEKR